VSGVSVAILVLWTIAVTVWTGFQVRGGELCSKLVRL
jgi:hypothetical protein